MAILWTLLLPKNNVVLYLPKEYLTISEQS